MFLRLELLEMYLMTLINLGRSCFETIPNFLTDGGSDRTDDTPLIMHLLQFAECIDYIRSLNQLLSLFANLKFSLKILAEIQSPATSC